MTPADRPIIKHIYQNYILDSTHWDGFEARDGDIVIATSYKTGTTWMQGICAALVFQAPEPPAAQGCTMPLHKVLHNVQQVWQLMCASLDVYCVGVRLVMTRSIALSTWSLAIIARWTPRTFGHARARRLWYDGLYSLQNRPQCGAPILRRPFSRLPTGAAMVV